MQFESARSTKKIIMNNSKILSFIFTVHPSFTPSCKVITPFTVNVQYKLYWQDNIEVTGICFKPELLAILSNREGLVQEIIVAAKKDSMRYAAPGKEKAGRVNQDPREQQENENQRVYK